MALPGMPTARMRSRGGDAGVMHGMRQGDQTHRVGPVQPMVKSQLSYGQMGLGDQKAHVHNAKGPRKMNQRHLQSQMKGMAASMGKGYIAPNQGLRKSKGWAA